MPLPVVQNSDNEPLLAGRGGGGGFRWLSGTYIPSLDFKYSYLTYWGVGYVPVIIWSINLLFVTIFFYSYAAVSKPHCLLEF